MGLVVEGLEFGVWEIGEWGLRFSVWGLGFDVWDVELRVEGL